MTLRRRQHMSLRQGSILGLCSPIYVPKIADIRALTHAFEEEADFGDLLGWKHARYQVF